MVSSCFLVRMNPDPDADDLMFQVAVVIPGAARCTAALVEVSDRRGKNPRVLSVSHAPGSRCTVAANLDEHGVDRSSTLTPPGRIPKDETLPGLFLFACPGEATEAEVKAAVEARATVPGAAPECPLGSGFQILQGADPLDPSGSWPICTMPMDVAIGPLMSADMRVVMEPASETLKVSGGAPPRSRSASPMFATFTRRARALPDEGELLPVLIVRGDQGIVSRAETWGLIGGHVLGLMDVSDLAEGRGEHGILYLTQDDTRYIVRTEVKGPSSAPDNRLDLVFNNFRPEPEERFYARLPLTLQPMEAGDFSFQLPDA